MDHFGDIMYQAMSIKSCQMQHRRKTFEAQPLFVKCGLYYLPKFENVRKQKFHQRYIACDVIKSEGNYLYSKADYNKAARNYEQALSIFRYINCRNPNWKNEGIDDEDLQYVLYEGDTDVQRTALKAMLLSIYLNLALCYIKLQDYQNSQAACNEALKIDPKNIKALYRRAKARTSSINATKEDYVEAVKDLKLAYDYNPQDHQVYQEYQRLKNEWEKLKSHEETVFKGIFVNQKTSSKGIQVNTDGRNEQKKTEETSPRSTTSEPAAKNGGRTATPVAMENELSSATTRSKSVAEPSYQVENAKSELKKNSSENEKVKDAKKTVKDIPPPSNIKDSKPDAKKNTSTNSNSNNTTVKDPKSCASSTTVNDGNRDLSYEDDDEDYEDEDETNDLLRALSDSRKSGESQDYKLSYDVNPNAKVPSEIEELGRFLESKGSEIVKLYEATGRYQEAQELKDKLRKAMQAKKQLEKIAVLDFDKPTDHLKEIAVKFGIDLHDPAIKSELIKIQNQNIQDIRNWLENMTGKKEGEGGEGDEAFRRLRQCNGHKKNMTSKTTNGRKKTANYSSASSCSSSSPSSVSSSSCSTGAKEHSSNKNGTTSSKKGFSSSSCEGTSSGGNNYYINNHFYNGNVSSQTNIVSNFTTNNIMNLGADARDLLEERRSNSMKDNTQMENSKLIRDILTNLSKMNEQGKTENTLTRIMNFVIIIVSILLILVTIFLHS